VKKTVIWSDRAASDYYDLLEYLAGNWGEKIAKQFAEKFNKI